MLVNNLYEQIIKREAARSAKLRVMSGYGSAAFLRKVAEEFPGLQIELFIGMSGEGITRNNHNGYRSLINENKNIKVYYQIDGAPTHMKILEFSSPNNKSVFIGSANFTENGFFNNREIMVCVQEDMEPLFNIQKEVSVSCMDINIEKKVRIIDGEPLELPDNSGEKLKEYENKKNEMPLIITDPALGSVEEKKHRLNRIMGLRKKASPKYYNKFDIEVVLEEKYNTRWDFTGINALFDGKEPALEQTPKIFFDTIFPVGEIINIYTDDGSIYHANVSGRFNGQLKLVDGNLYEYIQKRIGLNEFRAISRQDMIKYGVTKLSFERLNEKDYLMYFDLTKH
ncbi:phospholipase D family protein [Lysinibacillus sp. 3P01SB]|uniref:phospholipase D family protein n=1 Tax=Lysinibacillus sp. 3P01SB TaxID=3132284 RepID=UPI0039A6EE79